jgi:hypothetical protein
MLELENKRIPLLLMSFQRKRKIMKMKSNMSALGLLVACVTVIGAITLAQEPGPSVRYWLPGLSEGSSSPLLPTTVEALTITNTESSAISNALNKLKAAESDKDRDAGNAELRAALVDQFDKDIVRRKKELEAVATKLKEMQDLVAKRVESADKIIDLRMQVLLLDSKGLGWNSGSASDGRQFGVQNSKWLSDPFK